MYAVELQKYAVVKFLVEKGTKLTRGIVFLVAKYGCVGVMSLLSKQNIPFRLCPGDVQLAWYLFKEERRSPLGGFEEPTDFETFCFNIFIARTVDSSHNTEDLEAKKDLQ